LISRMGVVLWSIFLREKGCEVALGKGGRKKAGPQV
jgi:hypothetical protein